MVSVDRGSYYCFGCGAKGDIFTFVQEFEKLDFKEALKLLADRAGVVLDTYRAPEERQVEDGRDMLRKVMELAASYYQEQLAKDQKSLEYLTSRGLEQSTIEEWRLGSTKEGWSNVYEHLKGLGISDAHIEKAGLAKKGEKSGGFYDRFRSRIIFPIFDPQGKVIAFTGREKEWEKQVGKEDVHTAKYLNSPDTPLFDKSRTLYGFHKAKVAIPKWKCTLLVEGQMDLLMCHQAGYGNAVATSGTALTPQQLEMLGRFSKNILIAYDGDKAGIEAARRAWMLALSVGMDVKMALMPGGADPADLIKADVDAFKEVIKKGVHVVEFYLRALLARNLPPRELGKEVEHELLPYIKAIESPIDQAHFMTLVAARTGIKEEALYQALRTTPSVVGQGQGKAPLPEQRFDDTMLSQQHNSKHRLIAGTYLLLNNEDKAKIYIHNADTIRDELQFVVEEWLAKSGQSPEAYLADLLASAEKERLHTELQETMKAYLQADQEGDEAKAQEFLKKSDEIRRALTNHFNEKK